MMMNSQLNSIPRSTMRQCIFFLLFLQCITAFPLFIGHRTSKLECGGIFLAKEVDNGEWLTTGDPLNLLKAVIKYALDRDDIGKDLKEFLKSSVC